MAESAEQRRQFAEVLLESEKLIPQLQQMVGALNAVTEWLDAVRAEKTPDGETGE